MPTIHMTKSAVDALKAASKDTVYWDAGLPGFGAADTVEHDEHLTTTGGHLDAPDHGSGSTRSVPMGV